MAKKPDLDDEDKGAAAERRDAEKLAKLNEGKTLEGKDQDADEEIDLDDEPETDEPEVDDRPSRKERRRQRGESFVEQAKAEAEAARREAQEARERLARVEGQLAAMAKPQKDETADKYAAEKKQLRDRLNGVHARYNAAKANKTLTQEMVSQLEAEAEEIEEQRIVLVAKQRFGDQPAAPNTDDIVERVEQARFVREHHDVINHPSALLWAKGRLQQLVAEHGQTYDNPANVARVMDEARKKYGLKVRQPEHVSESNRSRLSGISRGSGGSGGNDGPRTITMTKEYRALADASHGHIKDKTKRYQTWAKTAGKRILEREAK